MTKEILYLKIAELSEKIRSREITPIEVVEQCISRITESNPQTNAFVTITAEEARQAAKVAENEIQNGKYRGPLHGVPIGIKDLIDTRGIRTTYGSAIFRENVPQKDATVVSRLKEAGAIVLGKTNTHEFALGVTTDNLHYGATRNPWKLDRIPGGSSGGSAAAVAAGMCYGAVGTDTGGSIRIPSAFCGIVGVKPTFGTVSTTGVFPLATGLDHVGPMTRCTKDAALMLNAMAGFDQSDPRSLIDVIPDFSGSIDGYDISETKIAICPDLLPKVMDHEVELAYRNAIAKIERVGGVILEKRLNTAHLVENVSTKLLLSEAYVQHSELLRKHHDSYGSNVIERFEAGQEITTYEYIKALRDNDLIRREIEILFREVDFLVTPSVQILAPKIGDQKVVVGNQELEIIAGCVRFTRLANVTGIPAVVIPYGYSVDGLPTSIQIMASKGRESQLIGFASLIENATPELRDRHPQL